jgi:urease accessory protein
VSVFKVELEDDYMRQLWLYQLADSALPIGTTAHSFGLETLAQEEEIQVSRLEAFLRDYLTENGLLESSFCRAAYLLGSEGHTKPLFVEEWLNLNESLGAFRLARESRAAGTALGRRFIQLVLNLDAKPELQTAWLAAKQAKIEIHYCTAFGLVGGVLKLGQEATCLAYLQQSLTGLISACQRLMPLGQSQASQILHNLKPVIFEVIAQRKKYQPDDETLNCFTPLVELASMRHPSLRTRLFIS